MLPAEKLSTLKTILDISGEGEDAVLTVYLSAAEQELLAWKYSYVAADNRPTSVPADDEITQIFAVVAGYSQRGNEAQSGGSENGVSRQWVFADMRDYIHRAAIPYAGVL